MNWTLNEFYSSGGTTKFVDRIAASLGIKAANVKVVSVYQGSVVVDFQISEDSTGTLAAQGGAESIQKDLNVKMATGKLSLGAQILSYSVKSVKKVATVTDLPATTATTGTSTTIVVTQPVTQPTTVPTTPITRPIVAPIVLNNTVISVQTEEESGSNSKLMIAVVASILGLIVFGGGAGYFLYKKYARASTPTLDQSSTKQNGAE